MRWELSAEQQEFQSVLRDWLARRCPSSRVRAWLDSGDPAEFEQDFAAEGWSAVGSPEALGGQGGDLIELALVAEELGRCAAPSSAWLGSVLAVPVLASTPDVAKELLADNVTTVPVVSCDGPPAGHALVESGHGITGSVRAVLGADRATRLLVPVRNSGFVLVDTESAGVVVRRRQPTDRSRSVADVELAAVQGTAVDAEVGVLADMASRAAVLISADALGVAERLLAMTVEYSLQRKQFGVPIGSFQAVKHAAAEMLVTVEAARSIVYMAAASVQAGHPEAALRAAAAKAQVTARVSALADTALTLHGAIGYTWEHDLQLYFKRAKLTERLFGSPSTWNERIATELALVP
ncbi:acyl-CoA dehydrogenase family protein [Labedaea rhizosphaerae]|uniref:Alkylation response protein AidB-like acyl-CoA dehydrogenase n=1 Tax=Labedaea rhizosphaerae TaxID=598644 RepID=A0A4V3CXW7_LABRH|nr:acyl-CoA dehydrogenase family protein [Labedaea rhizosphaerae]TDP91888.1 alkylation response protein AidB-like acyl-CoA dehydrogenase [Labedaea rhizosphaerae]